MFRSRWRLAWCIAGYESGHQLDPPHNNSARGPWQIEPSAHPWVSVYRLTHDWRYSAIAASRISKHGTNWSQWTTHSLCGV